VDLPAAPDGVYSATVFPDDLARQQVAHLDQYSGEVLLDVHVADYGAVARVLGVPAVPANLRVGKGAALIAVTLGALYPLVGASMVLMVLVEWILPGGARLRLA
jgi:uncharacterized iron-regulated membrane protein